MAIKIERLSPLFQKDVAAELQQAREMRAAWVRLNDQGLTALPEDVFTLTDLEGIDLGGNGFTTIPERLWDLPKLRHVNLLGNPIQSLPNHPGLIIDLPIFRRFRNQIEPQNTSLVIGVDVSEADASFWIGEVKSITTLNRLTIGEWHLFIGEGHPHPTPAVRKILDSLVTSTPSNHCLFAGYS